MEFLEQCCVLGLLSVHYFDTPRGHTLVEMEIIHDWYEADLKQGYCGQTLVT